MIEVLPNYKINNEEEQMSKLILPRTYEDKTTDGKYAHHNGKPKLSYSQYNSWKDSQYRPDYIKRYFAKIDTPGSCFTDFGTDVGTYKEWVGIGRTGEQPIMKYLSKEDLDWLDSLEYPENSIYEDLVVVDCGDFVMEGYIDRSEYIQNGVHVRDFKTGNIIKKTPEYASPDYQQTTLYCQKDVEGYEILGSDVMLLGRAGNNTQKNPLKLTQEFKIIPTPYSRDRALQFLDKVAVTAKEISEYYQRYLDIFG
jgi:hypothetical protein